MAVVLNWITAMTPLSFEIELTNLNCASCVARAETALAGAMPNEQVSVNLATRRAALPPLHGPEIDRTLRALSKAGYPAKVTTFQYHIENMHCASCVSRIEDAMEAQAGVVTSRANIADKTLWVETVDAEATAETYDASLARIGFAPTALDKPQEPSTTQSRNQGAEQRQAFWALVLAAPLLVLEMGGHLAPSFHHWLYRTFGQTPVWLVQALLASAIILGPARGVFRIGLPNLWRGHPDMNSLVALGSLAAWGYSLLVLMRPSLFPADARHVYFEATGIILALILLGRWLEARAKNEASSAISKLMQRLPDVATVLRDGLKQDIPTSQIKVGEHVFVAAGGRIPVDGIMTKGATEVDEAMMTGEPLPVSKTQGDTLIGGTINGAGALEFEATAVGANTALARILQTVQRAQAGKLPIQNLVDKISAWFVPAVLVIAVLTCLIWLALGPDTSHAVIAAVSVLIIACPCAMGLATPMSVLVSSGRGADLGVLFRKGNALQHLGEVKLVAFDKTGTLTEGKPRIASVHCVGDIAEQTALTFASALEAHSQHPIAKAFQQASDDIALPKAHNLKEHPGGGIEGIVDGQKIHLGSARFLNACGIGTHELTQLAESLSKSGHTPVLLAVDGKAIACFALADTVKPSAKSAIATLHNMGVTCAMITGDREDVATSIAADLGILVVHAEVTPEGKAQHIQSLQAQHGQVAFVGDGINDAPALAQADVGLALGSGMDVAMETADVVLRDTSLHSATNAIRLSKATLKNIKQNLFWAFAYNILLIPVAAGALYPIFGITFSPIFGAAAMALSSVFVVTNALRLRRFQPQEM